MKAGIKADIWNLANKRQNFEKYFKEMLEASNASMIIQNNDTITAYERRRNQEQRDNRNSRWTGKEKKLIALTCLSYWPLIGIAIFCYIKFLYDHFIHNSAQVWL